MNATTNTPLNARQRKALAKAEKIAAAEAAANAAPAPVENTLEQDAPVEEPAAETPVEQPVEQPVAKGRNSIVPLKYKERYGKDGNCGDELAAALNAAINVGEKGTASLDALVEVGNQNGVDVMKKWGERNIGQKRMNLGNVLRGKLKRGEQVVVGDQTFGAAPVEEQKAG